MNRTLQVLLVDDNQMMQRLGVVMLNKMGHSGVVVDDGRKMLDCLALKSFDVVLLDVMMPRMDGLEALALLREAERTKGGHQPVIMVTSHDAPGDVTKLLAAGADGWVPKPVKRELLEAELKRVLGHG